VTGRGSRGVWSGLGVKGRGWPVVGLGIWPGIYGGLVRGLKGLKEGWSGLGSNWGVAHFQSLRATVATTHVQMIKVKGHSILELEWKQTDGRTDGGNCLISPR